MKRLHQFLIITVIALLLVTGVLIWSYVPLRAQTTLKVQYMTSVADSPSNKLKPDLQIVNTGTSSVPLNQLTLRYWFTRDTAQEVSATCDYAALGCNILTGKTVAVSSPASNADYYLEIGFISGTLAANSSAGKFKMRIWKGDYSDFNQTNDYSFNASQADFADWQKVTLYHNGTLIWGTQPDGVIATPNPTSTLAPVTPIPTSAATSTPAQGNVWVGTFEDFPSSSWINNWGKLNSGAWGFGDMSAISDATSPRGQVLDVTYGAGSSAPSCKDCPDTGGGQFYTDFAAMGRADLKASPTLSLKYYVKFPTNFEWGRGGKLPGLYGGPTGCQSGGDHCGWSTRYMWRNRSAGPSLGELYYYDPTDSGYGADLGLGKWSFASDGQWHSIEQLVDRQAGTTTIWYDDKQVFIAETPNIQDINFEGIFFSTFFGGHETSWGPTREVHARFAAFSVSMGAQH